MHPDPKDLDADPGPLPQNFLCPLNLWTIVEQVEYNIRVCEFSAHARRRGLNARPWAVFRETALALAGLHRREVGA